MMSCPSCGAATDDDAPACLRCGLTFGAPAAPPSPETQVVQRVIRALPPDGDAGAGAEAGPALLWRERPQRWPPDPELEHLRGPASVAPSPAPGEAAGTRPKANRRPREAEEERRRCPGCGTRNDPDLSRCRSCGARFPPRD